MSTVFEFNGNDVYSLGHTTTALFAAHLNALEAQLGQKSGVYKIMGDTYSVDNLMLSDFVALALDASIKCEHPIWRLFVTPVLSVLLVLVQRTGGELENLSQWPQEIIEGAQKIGLKVDSGSL